MGGQYGARGGYTNPFAHGRGGSQGSGYDRSYDRMYTQQPTQQYQQSYYPDQPTAQTDFATEGENVSALDMTTEGRGTAHSGQRPQ